MTDERQSEARRLITVCAVCLRATCWQGKFYCEAARYAKTTRKSVRELRALGLEHEDYWTPDCEAGLR
jgi:hypothetical protein